MHAKTRMPGNNGHTNGVALDGQADDIPSNGHADAEAGEKPGGPAVGGACEGDNEGDPYIRMECGRFMPGNRGGPGNPFARHTAAMRAAISAAVPRERLMRIADKVAEIAEEGSLAAARLIFRYCGGVPGPTPNPDTLDAQEMEGRRAATVTADDLDLVEVKMPAHLLCLLAHHATPEVRRAWALDRERRQREAPGAGVAAPAGEDTAGPRPAARPEEAPAQAPPAQAPPAQAPGRGDGLPDGAHVEDVVRGLAGATPGRSGTRMAGAPREGDGRRSVTSSVTKREMRKHAERVSAGPEVPAAGANGDGRGTERR